MGGVQQARRGLIGAGFGAALSASANRRGGLNGATPEEECAHLAEIASYIGETDPLVIGAAWLLEQCGHSLLRRKGDTVSAFRQLVAAALIGFTVRSRFTGNVFVVTDASENGGRQIVRGPDCWAMLDAVTAIAPPGGVS